MGILNLTGQEGQSSEDDVKPTEVDNTDGEVKVVDATEINADSQQGKEQVVVMDGPLSQIYTQALNMAFAKEDTGTMMSMLKIIHHGGKIDPNVAPQAAFVDASGSYVYATDEQSLDKEGLVGALESLREAVKSKKYKQVVLAMEGRSVSSKMQLLDEASRQMGVRVCMTRGGFTSVVLEGFKG